MFDALIIGGGPAGATCALWLKMLGHRPILIEKRNQIGGLQADSPYLNQWVPMLMQGMRGQDVADTMHATMQHHNIAMALNAEVQKVTRQDNRGFLVDTTAGQFDGRYLVLASGVRSASGGLRAALNVLIGPGHAVASHDFTGRRVAILGGGDNAFENYLFIRAKGAASVTIFARTLKARAEFLAQVPVEDIRLGAYEVNAEANQVNGDTFDRLLVLYGWEAHLPYLASCPVALNERGFVVTGQDCDTSQPDIYAIGEIAQRWHPCCITSMADGVTAAKAIQRQLEQGSVSRFLGMAKRAVGMATSI